MGRTACTESQCLYKGALYLTSVPVQGCTLPYLSACTKAQFTYFTFTVLKCKEIKLRIIIIITYIVTLSSVCEIMICLTNE
jgi:hypothetical protein